jgi:hypothetical protein
MLEEREMRKRKRSGMLTDTKFCISIRDEQPYLLGYNDV